jgi:YgiT-type zinc finger domain-containing protein
MTGDENSTSEFCESCHVGSLQACRATYARWHDGDFVVLPGVPAWRCDYCGDTFYDREALRRLVLLLGPESSPEVETQRRATGFEDSDDLGLTDRRRMG